MRSILSIFLFSILFQNIITNKDNLNRIARASITLRNLVKYKKDLMRKLQASTDETPEGLYTVPTDIPAETAEAAKETLNPEPKTFSADKTDFLPETPKIEPKKNGTSGLPTGNLFQIKKFHKFSKPKGSRKLNFNVFFSFFNKEIVKTIIMRVVIKYSSRRTLRGLADADTIAGESIRTVCEIKPDYANLEGKKGTGDNIDYDCNGETSSNREVSDAKVDTKSPMVIGKESVEVKDIEFHEDSAEGANNLVKSPDKDMGVFNIQNWNTQDKKLILTGKVLPSDLLTSGTSYPVEFYDTQGDPKKIDCTALNSDGSWTLNCDTSENPLSTKVGNLALSKSDVDDVYFTFNLPEGAPLNDPINAGASSHSNTFYRKSSSGLSGGAIAGIVIACVVVLAAASIAAIMLRKPAPPVDNTTVVGLKTVENI